jgi:hypothetical protein
MYPSRTWSLEPIMTLMMLIIKMILCVTHNGYSLHDTRECFKISLESLSSLTFYCNLESWDLINLSWTLKGFCKSIIFQGKTKKKKKLFQLTKWALCFVILALNCKALLLGALVVAMLASLLASWQELFPCTWFAKICPRSNLGAMSLFGNDHLGPFVYYKTCPTSSWLGCWLWCWSLEWSCVSHKMLTIYMASRSAWEEVQNL